MIRLNTRIDSSQGVLVETAGLTQVLGQREIRVRISDSLFQTEAEQLLNYIANYLKVSGKCIGPGETMPYGYWLLRFEEAPESVLEAWEYNAEATDFIMGVDLTLRYWREQHIVCRLHGGDFKPPRPDKLSVISEGVLEGATVEGVRYPSPDHMSGWWITTDLYDGNLTNLKLEHTYHITAARPELAKYLALPNGFRFDLKEGETVWLDKDVAVSRP